MVHQTLTQDDPRTAVGTIAAAVEAHASASERDGRLAEPIVHALFDAQLHKMLAPVSVGGLETDPLSFHEAIRAVGRLDGSTSWCTWVANLSAWFCSRMSHSAAERLLKTPDAYVAGALFPFGTARRVPGGYQVTGHWPYGSGSAHATWFQGACVVHDDAGPRMVEGQPEVRIVVCPREETRIIDTWDVSGLAATRSDDFAFDDVFVPEELTIILGAPASPDFPSALYRFPLAGVVPASVAASGLGIAERAIDETLALARTKVSAGTTGALRERPVFQVQMADAVATLGSAEAWLTQQLSAAWDRTLRDEAVGIEERGRMVLAATHGTRSAARAVELAYLSAGGTANYAHSPLQRCMRDVHAVTQHMAAAPHMYEPTGKVLSGLDPENPIFHL